MSLAFASLSPIPPLRSTTHNFNSRCTHRTFALNYASKTEEPETSRPDKRTIPVEKKVEKPGEIELEVLYDDGFGSLSVNDYFRAAKDVVRDDGGPPRWFSPVECSKPVNNAPLLLFLPGYDGVGLGLILHHKSLGKVFEIRCLHIPVKDRTSFEGLIHIVEKCIKSEHSVRPNRPIFLLGDSFGGCLALAVAARNPKVDLVLVLVNPATSFDKSPLQPLFPLLENLPSNLHVTVPYMLSFVMGDPIKMAMAGIKEDRPSPQTIEKLSNALTSMLPLLSELAEIIPRETLLWKLKLLKSAAAYTNSRLHAVKAPVLVLTSGKDNLLPSADEGDRLFSTLKNCKVRHFKDNGHTLLLEDGVNLLTVIKGAGMYRRSRRRDVIMDHLPPTKSEYNKTFIQGERWFSLATSPVYFSTLPSGEIVRGLEGVPKKGPVLLVSYHMLWGLDLSMLYKQFLDEIKVTLFGMAHPVIFSPGAESSRRQFTHYDSLYLFGGIPVSPVNMYRLLQRGSFVLLFPGGAREALHRKGEEYKLFWPKQPEFVRMAARFGATIVPYGVVGEDDLTQMVLDYDDQKKIPFVRDWVEDMNKDFQNIRSNLDGEVADQEICLPFFLPKVPGRFYYLFGKPIETKRKEVLLQDRENAMAMYSQIKLEVEGLISYLKKRREEDPYRSIAQRALFRATWGPSAQIPTFEL
ncbi:Esterase/lipase/thioesterase-like protein [Rhynchospora pubera]|uniref:Esterase/lipase/thioesterase-like protein n=1 Tax=Rhynchospora pubera TaxID=906938 RepID=A0AAV8DGR7_9POAL|nr:Esterase/lipase/thioesterase-like protein [Rhynchospora pubera]